MLFILWGSGQDIIIMLIVIAVNFISGILLTWGKPYHILKEVKRTLFQKCIFISLHYSKALTSKNINQFYELVQNCKPDIVLIEAIERAAKSFLAGIPVLNE
jgi:hypothetical protein